MYLLKSVDRSACNASDRVLAFEPAEENEVGRGGAGGGIMWEESCVMDTGSGTSAGILPGDASKI